jgi:ribosomal-protein-alanine N-acetyltransferase
MNGILESEVMELNTARLIIRPFEMTDLEDVFEYCSQSDVGPLAGWRPMTSMQETASFLHDWIIEGCRHAIVRSDTGKVIGHIAINPDSEEGREDTRELGVALNHDDHHMGYMSEAVQAVLKQLFDTDSGVDIMWACCFKENVDSRKMIERNGFLFQQEGLFHSTVSVK